MKGIAIILIIAVVGIGAYMLMSQKPSTPSDVMQKGTDVMEKGADAVEKAGDTMQKIESVLEVPEGAVAYTVDPKTSKIEWSAEKKIALGKHNGTVDIKSGMLYKVADKEKGDMVMGQITVDMDTIVNLDGDKPNDGLIKHLKSVDFFDVTTYPEAMVEFTATVDPAVTVEAGAGTPFKATGTMTIRGKTNPVEFSFVATEDEAGMATSSTEIVIDRSKYGVAFGTESLAGAVGDKIIKDEIPLTISLTAKKN